MWFVPGLESGPGPIADLIGQDGVDRICPYAGTRLPRYCLTVGTSCALRAKYLTALELPPVRLWPYSCHIF